MHDEKENLDQTLVWACHKGFRDIVELLLDNGANINTNHGDCLHLAVRNEDTSLVKLLLQKGVSPQICCESLYIACYNQNDIILRLLLDNILNIDIYESSLMPFACRTNNKIIIKTLLEYGVSPHLDRKYFFKEKEAQEAFFILEQCISELKEGKKV